MKIFLVLILLASFSAFADETCQTSLYDFKITSSYIQARGQGLHIRIEYREVRSLSRRSMSDFKAMINLLSDADSTDDVLTTYEVPQIDRFSITVADGNEGLITLKYIKSYDQSGMLFNRFMMTQNGVLRCQ